MPPRSPVPVGINIGVVDVAVSEENGGQRGVYVSAPPAAILPAVRGEPVEASSGINIDQFGQGLPWPTTAVVSKAKGSGRVPAAYAWRLIEQKQFSWTWDHCGFESTVTGAEAIAAIAHGCLQDGGLANGQPALVVPNTIDLDAQEDLLRRMRAKRIREPLLLWRPIAAALAWLDWHGAKIHNPDSVLNESIGSLACLHMGFDGCEADIVEIIPTLNDNRVWLLPARSRPTVRTLYEFPLWSIEAAASHGLTEQQGWNRLWCTDWLQRQWERCSKPSKGTPKDQFPESSSRDFAWLTACDLKSKSPVTKLREHWGTNSPDRRETLFADREMSLIAWIDYVFDLLTEHTILGAVFTGEMANFATSNQGSSESVATKMGERVGDSGLLLLHDSLPVGGVLAHGAALFAGRHIRQEPTYLDTLPTLETLAMRKGEPCWQNLVEQEDRYVLGGRKLTFIPNDLGFRVQAEERSLTISIAQEGFESVREVHQAVEAELKQDLPVKLRVEIAAGQGNPRVEVLPIDTSVLLGQRVYLDWDRATDTGKTKEAITQEVPRTNPPLDRRVSSYGCWQGFFNDTELMPMLERSVALLDTPHSCDLPPVIKALYKRLWSGDPNFRQTCPPVHGTAFDCDGAYPEQISKRGIITKFVQKSVPILTETDGTQLRRDLYRTLGYMSSDSPLLLRILQRKLKTLTHEKAHERSAILIACGNCLRDAADIAEFARTMADVLELERSAPADWMRALCRILRYREHATQCMGSDLCGRLAWQCHKVAERQIKEESAAKYLYRFGTLSVAYLLRRRRYDDGYLDPDSREAKVMKRFLKSTIKGMRNGIIDVLDGVVDPVHVTQTIIDYIDRKGRGRLVVDE